MAVRTVAAAALHVGYVVIPGAGPPRMITAHRLQGTPAEAVVQYAGIDGWHHLPVDAQVVVETRPADGIS